MQRTNIGWCDFSANLLKYKDAVGNTVWGCVKTSAGCARCYAEALAKRWARGEAFTAENMKVLTPFFDEKEAQQVLKSKKISGQKVFVDDMTDLFGDWVSDEIILQHFAVFALRPDVTFQILTKRAKRMKAEISASDFQHRTELYAQVYVKNCEFGPDDWPLPNVHVGVSVEDDKNRDRVADLVLTPAAVRWVSVEPLLATLNLDSWLDPKHALSLKWWQENTGETVPRWWLTNKPLIDGIVIGGETGAGHKEMPLEPAIALANQAKEAGVSVYVKQDSGPRPGMQGRIPDDVWAMKDWPKAA